MQYRLFVRVEEGGKTNTKDGLSRRVRNGSFLTFRTYQSTLPERSVAPTWQIPPHIRAKISALIALEPFTT